MMKNKLFLVLAMATIISGAPVYSGTLWAQDELPQASSRQDAQQKREAWLKELNQRLNLTAEQDRMLQENMQRNRESAKELNARLKSAREAVKEELGRNELDMAAISKLHAQVKDLQMQMEDVRLSGILEVRKILTAQQYAEFKKFSEERRHERHQKKQDKED